MTVDQDTLGCWAWLLRYPLPYAAVVKALVLTCALLPIVLIDIVVALLPGRCCSPPFKSLPTHCPAN